MFISHNLLRFDGLFVCFRSLLVGIHDLTQSPEDVKEAFDKASERQRRQSGTARMPELPIDSLLQAQPPRRASSLSRQSQPSSLNRVSVLPEEMLASYQRTAEPSSTPESTASRTKDSFPWSTVGNNGDDPSASDASSELRSAASDHFQTLREKQPFFRHYCGGLLSDPAEEGDGVPPMTRSIYYLGIIDTFQKYTLGKQLERAYKVHVKRCDPGGVSSINVRAYATRFMAKMESIFV